MNVLSIKASDIENWTNREPRRAQELLPKLLWKLILASSNNIEDHHFPFENAVQYNGYDGFIKTTDNNPFYPNGISVWEFGTDEDIKGKFNKDFNKRSQNPNNIDPKQATFCFVTSRIWNHREGIAEFTIKKQKEGIWKNVRIIDANNLEMWLDQCPSVSVWFSKIIGKDAYDLIDLATYWDNIVSKTNPQLTVEFFRIGREKLITEEIMNLIEKNEKLIILSTDSKIEGILTIAAELLENQDIKYKQLLSKIIVALSSEALNNACQNFNDSIIIPAFKNEKDQINIQGTIIIPTEKNGPIDLLYKNSARCHLPSRRHRDFSASLESIGFNANEADKMTYDVKCRFSPLLQKLTSDVNLKMPYWLQQNNDKILVPALLANAWDSNYNGDKEAIELLSGKSFDEYIESIQDFTIGDSAPIFNLDNSYACISVNELWDILLQSITGNNFKRYKECVKMVFSEKDPVYELPEEKRSFASLYEKQSRFSSRLKKGLILSMTKIVEFGEDDKTSGFCSNSVNECNALVTEIFDKLNSRQDWFTICEYIPDFVEATPDVIAGVIEKNIKDEASEFWCLFENLDSSFFGRTYYTSILWALEKLMWLEQYCIRAVYSLVKIAEKKFNYKMKNSPIDSLYKFFCLWNPQGFLSLEDRILLLSKIIKEYYFTGRNLIDILFPSGPGIVDNLLEFEWRYIEKKKIEVTTKDYYNSIKIIAEHFVKTLTVCYDDWKLIIKYFPIFDKAFETLKVDKNDLVLSIPDDDKLKLCKDLICKISRHKKFANEDWSLPENTLNKLEQLYDILLPNSPLKYVAFYSHDFYGMNPCVFDKENYDYEKEKNELQKERVETLEKIIDEFGLDSLYQIVPQVSDIDLLVNSLTCSKYVDNITIDFIKTAHNKIPRFAEMLVNSMYYVKGISFFHSLVDNESKDVQFIINQLPIKPDVIELIDKMSEEQQIAYWENVNVWILPKEKEFAQYCLIKLLQANRPYSVMKQLCFDDFGNSEIILEALHQGLLYYPNSENNGICLNSISSYELEELFEKLYNDKNVDPLQVSRLEFAYVQKFDLDFEPKCLIENLLSDPSLFLEIISCFYKNDDHSDEVLQKVGKSVLTNTFEVLRRIKQLPGQQGNEINKENFDNWITEVRKLAKERKYEKACDMEIGKILSYSPIDEDGVWPHKYVREFFELNSSEILENNFRIGLFNQRGVHAVTGGDEEEKIAKKYYDYAEKLRISYPRTSYILKTIGDSFKSESQCERARELKGYY